MAAPAAAPPAPPDGGGTEAFSIADTADEEVEAEAEVQCWLRDLGLGKYTSVLVAEGLDSMSVVKDLQPKDIEELVGLCSMPRLHAKQFRRGVAAKQEESEGAICVDLREPDATAPARMNMDALLRLASALSPVEVQRVEKMAQRIQKGREQEPSSEPKAGPLATAEEAEAEAAAEARGGISAVQWDPEWTAAEEVPAELDVPAASTQTVPAELDVPAAGTWINTAPPGPEVPDGVWPLDAWIDQYSEDAVAPSVEIIDSQIFLWDPRTQPRWDDAAGALAQLASFYACTSPSLINTVITKDLELRGRTAKLNSCGWRQLPDLQPYMAEEFLFDLGNRGSGKRCHSVQKSVYFSMGWHSPGEFQGEEPDVMLPLEEAQLIEEVHRCNPNVCHGVVLRAKLADPRFPELLDALQTCPLVRGFLLDIFQCEDEQLESSGEIFADTDPRTAVLRENLALLEQYDLSLDVRLCHKQLSWLARLVALLPRCRVVLQNFATPLGMSSFNWEETFPEWEAGMRAVAAASPNVYVKLSGFGSPLIGYDFHQLAVPPTSEALATAWRPFFKVCLEAFGPERCMLGSNFPWDKVSCDYTVMWNAFKIILQEYPAEVQQQLLSSTADHFYRLSG